jgi:hypothetical protein
VTEVRRDSSAPFPLDPQTRLGHCRPAAEDADKIAAEANKNGCT